MYPYWATQVWYPQLLPLMKSPSISIKMHRKTIILPHQPEQVHPLYWRNGTRKQYCTYITAWLKYCSECNISQVNPKLQQVLHFLTLQSKLWDIVRLQLSVVHCQVVLQVGDHSLVSRVMTELFNQKLALPCFFETWGPQIVL